MKHIVLKIAVVATLPLALVGCAVGVTPPPTTTATVQSTKVLGDTLYFKVKSTDGKITVVHCKPTEERFCAGLGKGTKFTAVIDNDGKLNKLTLKS